MSSSRELTVVPTWAGKVPAPEVGVTLSVVVVGAGRSSADGCAAILGAAPGVTVVGRASTGEDAERLTCRLRPQVVVIDRVLPDGDGASLAERLRDRRPEMATVLIAAAYDETSIVAAVDAGCAGCVPGCDVGSELVEVVRAAARGDMTFPAWARTGRIPRRRDPEATARKLTPREYAVLELLVAGQSTTRIAESLGVTPNTVRGHVRNVRTKLRAGSTAEAIRTATRYGVFR